MKTTKLTLFVLWCLLITVQLQAQKEESTFYATMQTEDATSFAVKHPHHIKIIRSVNGQSAVRINKNTAHELHKQVLVHGPGFVYASSEADALATLSLSTQRTAAKQAAPEYTITQGEKVREALELVDNTRIASQIRKLESYGTRYHTTAVAKRAVSDLQDQWEALARGRSDISVRLVNHSSTSMPSVVMTIRGTEDPGQYVILGGHMDSTARGSATTDAPGADDNASGIATITEVARVLIDMNYRPKRTIEFMAFAAEEVGLRGSREIAQSYKNNNTDVVAYLQFDMTNYKGSARDIYISTDSYNSSSLNNFLTELMDEYNSAGKHRLSYGTSQCNYGCSDHFSWAQEGYPTSFPFEATFRQSNPNIHTSRDTFDRSPTPNATHAAKFAKLGLEYMIEIASAGDTDGGGGSDPCEGVEPYQSGVRYQVGDRVTFRGNLYERQTRRWELLGPCGSNGVFGGKISDLAATETAFTMFPNPNPTDEVTITVENNTTESAVVLISDTKGSIIAEYNVTSESVTIPVVQWTSGIYFVTLLNNGQEFTKRLVIE